MGSAVKYRDRICFLDSLCFIGRMCMFAYKRFLWKREKKAEERSEYLSGHGNTPLLITNVGFLDS